MHPSEIQIILLPDPDDYPSPEDGKWQEECEKLLSAIKEKVSNECINISPANKCSGFENTRGPDLYYVLSATLAAIGGFKTLYNLLKLWVENRNLNRERVTVKIKYGGNEINVSNVSREEAEDLLCKYFAK